VKFDLKFAILFSRLHQITKLYLFSPSSGLYSCPLAMTDGAAKILKASGKHFAKYWWCEF
jgi:hypothetical protein